MELIEDGRALYRLSAPANAYFFLLVSAENGIKSVKILNSIRRVLDEISGFSQLQSVEFKMDYVFFRTKTGDKVLFGDFDYAQAPPI